MNGEEFYCLFKQALDALGVNFRNKEKITVSVCNGSITFFDHEQDISFSKDFRTKCFTSLQEILK